MTQVSPPVLLAESVPQTPPVNIGEMAKSGQYQVSIQSTESELDAGARRATEAADAMQKRRMSFILFCFALIFITIVFAGTVYLFASGSPDDKKWAGGIVTSITTGLIGYLVGKAAK